MSSISSGTTLTTALVQTADTSGVLQLQTNGGTTALTLDISQNVGIGTTSPSSQIHINGNSDNLFTAGFRVNRYTTAGQYGTVNYANGNFNITAVDTALSSPAITFRRSTDGSTTTESARIDTSGNLLVGTTSQLSNGLICASFNPSVKQGITLQNSSGTNCVYIGFNNASNSQIGYISGNGSAIAYNTSSDYRLKENIAPMIGALAIVAQLKPVTYDWISDKSKGQGFIAHELQAVVPDCVTGEKDAVDSEGNPVYQGIDTSFLVATLTSAIQELSAQVTTLQTQVTALKG